MCGLMLAEYENRNILNNVLVVFPSAAGSPLSTGGTARQWLNGLLQSPLFDSSFYITAPNRAVVPPGRSGWRKGRRILGMTEGRKQWHSSQQQRMPEKSLKGSRKKLVQVRKMANYEI